MPAPAETQPRGDTRTRTDAALASELRAAVMRLRRRLASERDPSNDLSIGQMTVLALLQRLGDQSVGQLARAEKVQPPSMTRTVNCLEQLGHVVRRAHESDGRQVVVSLTKAGRAAVLADRRRRDAWLAQRLRELRAAAGAALRAAAPILAALAQAD